MQNYNTLISLSQYTTSRSNYEKNGHSQRRKKGFCMNMNSTGKNFTKEKLNVVMIKNTFIL